MKAIDISLTNGEAMFSRINEIIAKRAADMPTEEDAADLAARTLAEIEDARSDPAPSPEEIEAKKAKLAEARNEQNRLAGAVKTLEADERAAAIADEWTP